MATPVIWSHIRGLIKRNLEFLSMSAFHVNTNLLLADRFIKGFIIRYRSNNPAAQLEYAREVEYIKSTQFEQVGMISATEYVISTQYEYFLFTVYNTYFYKLVHNLTCNQRH